LDLFPLTENLEDPDFLFSTTIYNMMRTVPECRAKHNMRLEIQKMIGDLKFDFLEKQDQIPEYQRTQYLSIVPQKPPYQGSLGMVSGAASGAYRTHSEHFAPMTGYEQREQAHDWRRSHLPATISVPSDRQPSESFSRVIQGRHYGAHPTADVLEHANRVIEDESFHQQ
jgi:hypothetical protein